MTCADPPPADPNYRIAHAQKKKARNNVCGAPPKGNQHTPKRKKQEITCAEPPQKGNLRTSSKKIPQQ